MYLQMSCPQPFWPVCALLLKLEQLKRKLNDQKLRKKS
jgi:hypothetical protein